MTVLPRSLDNAVWSALHGPHAGFAETVGRAARYRRDVSVFDAVPDAPDAADWDALRTLVGPGAAAFLFRPDGIAVPESWAVTGRIASLQMVLPPGREVRDVPTAAVRPVADLEALDRLVRAARPGPWLARTVELGPFVGVEVEGELVAVAGTRFDAGDAVEISAVATAEAARGQGLARAVVAAQVEAIRARGAVPFLHLLAENHAARRSYERLGFEVRAAFDGIALAAPA